MDDIFLYNINKKHIEQFSFNAIEKLYYFEAKIPTESQIENEIKNNIELKNFVEKFLTIIDAINNIKKNISIYTDKIPLYDIKTKNLYLIKDDDLYNYIIHLQYRFPDKILANQINTIKSEIEGSNDNDPINLRILRKIKLMFKFWNQLDVDELYKTYIKAYYDKNIGKNIITCVRPSYIPYFKHLKPYYTRDEIINLSLNMELVDEKDINIINLDQLCEIINSNDVDSKMLLLHQKHIASNDSIGLIQYYTIQGSSLMNNYLRNLTSYDYHNIYLEKQITPLWKLIKKAPAFDKDYIVYRFISTDKFLKHLNEGDIFIEPGFMSTTRDPFYRPDTYSFGTVLLKIRIPKDIIGVALCVETYSHFPEEQEIIFPPRSRFKLKHKFKNIKYYYNNATDNTQIDKKYEFEYIGSESVNFVNRTKFIKNIRIVDFKQLIELNNGDNLRAIIDNFMTKYANYMDISKIKIGNKIFYAFIENYDGLGAYKNFYAIKNKNGFAIYSFYRKYLLFIIEIGIVNDEIQMHINYYTKYNKLRRDKIINNVDFADFISSIAYYFHAEKVIIYADYMACNNTNNSLHYTEKEIASLSGNYCIDFYNYLKYGIKRYNLMGDITVKIKKLLTNKFSKLYNIELYPQYSFEYLDKLKFISPNKILNKNDNDELYQVFIKSYIVDNNNNNIADFFIWLIENKCYLLDLFIKKITNSKIMSNNDNPFINDYYIFNIKYYLYNRYRIFVYPWMNYIKTY